MTTVSIAMATFNGEKYLLDQLESFARQTRRPDEIVIVDDGSTDRTLEIARTWSRKASMTVRLFVNNERLGVTANFEKAIGLATSDIVFLSDQDDLWLPEKIARVLEEFSKNAEALVVINDQWIADHNLRSTGQTSYHVCWKKNAHLYDARSLVSAHGCCIAIRRPFLELALPIPQMAGFSVGHDVWLAKLSAIADRQHLVLEPLQLYRRHGAADSIMTKGGSLPPVASFKLSFSAVASDAPSRQSSSPSTSQIRLTLLRLVQSLQENWDGFFCQKNEKKRRMLRNLALLDEISERLKAPGIDSQRWNIPLALERLGSERGALLHRLDLYERPWLNRRSGAIQLLLQGDYKYAAGWKSFLVDFLRS